MKLWNKIETIIVNNLEVIILMLGTSIVVCSIWAISQGTCQ